MPRNGVIIGAFLVVFVITVLPVIIYRRCEMLFWKIKHWLGKDEAELPSQPARIDPVFTETLDNGISRPRITGDSGPRIGK